MIAFHGLLVTILCFTQISTHAIPKSKKGNRSFVNIGASAPLRVTNKLLQTNEPHSTQIRRSKIPIVILNTNRNDFNKLGNLQSIGLDSFLNTKLSEEQSTEGVSKLSNLDMQLIDSDNYFKKKLYEVLNRRKKKEQGNLEVQLIDLDDHIKHKVTPDGRDKKKLYRLNKEPIDLHGVKEQNRKEKATLGNLEVEPIYLNDVLKIIFNKGKVKKAGKLQVQPIDLNDYLENENVEKNKREEENVEVQSIDVHSYLKHEFNKEEMEKQKELSKLFDKNGMIYISKPNNNEDKQLNYLMYKVAKYGKDNEKKGALRIPMSGVFSPEEIRRIKKIARAMDREDVFETEQPEVKSEFEFSDLVV